MEQYKVIIIGAGPAGLSASMYLHRSGLSTLVIDDGRTLMNSAYLDRTYLGLVEPVTGQEFLQRAHQQVSHMGIILKQAKVTRIGEIGDLYEVVTDIDRYQTEFIILASGVNFKTPELAIVELEDNDEPYIKKRIRVDERGRTSKPRIYAAGIAAGFASQAIIAAGNGAHVALNLVSDLSKQRICIHDRKPVLA